MMMGLMKTSVIHAMAMSLGVLLWLCVAVPGASAVQDSNPTGTPEDKTPITLATDSKTNVIIYHAPDAPISVQMAAKELARILRAATGATFEIRTEPATPMISLGSNDSAKSVGLDGASMPEESFRILTRDQNVYIVGHDTRDDQRTARGGRSWGTSYGVSTFLERAVNVRWLMPGPVGEVIPQQSSLTISSLDIIEKPDFA